MNTMSHKPFDIDFSNYGQLLDLMNRADEFPDMLVGQTPYGEFVHTSIFKDKIIAEIFQTNNWIQKLTFELIGEDIVTTEEFEKC